MWPVGVAGPLPPAGGVGIAAKRRKGRQPLVRRGAPNDTGAIRMAPVSRLAERTVPASERREHRSAPFGPLVSRPSSLSWVFACLGTTGKEWNRAMLNQVARLCVAFPVPLVVRQDLDAVLVFVGFALYLCYVSVGFG